MIRQIAEKDIPKCVKVIKESFLTVANEFGFTIENAPRFTAFATTEERLVWQLYGEHRPMYAFYENGKIVGYYSLLLQENNECELNNLAVLPVHRHKGIGEALLKDAFKVAKEMNCAKMNIGIVEENQVLRKWYEEFGFTHTGTQKFDFSIYLWVYGESAVKKKLGAHMIQFGSIYLIVKDFDKTIEFYKALLEKDVDAQNMTRFAIFNVNGLCLSIMNGYFDTENPDKVDIRGNRYDEYDNMPVIAEKTNCGKVVINLSTNDLQKEYQRIRSLGIDENITTIRYINAKMPYYYFSMKDPDGNTIEITGPYEEKE